MTTLSEFKTLHAVTDALYQRDMASFRAIVAEERGLRGKLKQLDVQLRQSHEALGTNTDMRSIGADVIWQAWVGRTKVSLNMDLAKVLAIKEQRVAQIRRAFGKRSVAQQLLQSAHKAEADSAEQSRTAEILESCLTKF